LAVAPSIFKLRLLIPSSAVDLSVQENTSMLTTRLKRKLRKILPKPIAEALSALRYSGARNVNPALYIRHVAGKKGIEIGGPSTLFTTVLPLYRDILGLDGVNFSTDTVWEGQIRPGLHFNFFAHKKGFQFIADATDLSQIKDESYDFLLSSNCLEHVANPLKALMEWKRIIMADGALILVLPNKVSNFDHNRPTTSFDHILADFNNNTTEHDLTHLDEILRLHDLSMDPPAGNLESFRKRSLENFRNRALHHHVFDLSVIDYCGFEIIQSTTTNNDFFTLSTKRS
jgi:SAM-dependent methyltransferase